MSVKLKRACDQADNDAAGRSSATEVRSPGGGVPGGGACVRGAAARMIWILDWSQGEMSV